MRLYTRCFYRLRIRRHSAYNGQACVLASNHRSFWDPPLVGMWHRHPMGYFARGSLWKLPIVGWTLKKIQAIPVNRDEPAMESLRRTIAVLESGKPVIVFPEGTRSKTGYLGRFKTGPAMFARRANVPVVPVYLYHPERIWRRGWWMLWPSTGRVEVVYGKPVSAPEGLKGRQQDKWMTNYLKNWMEVTEQKLFKHSCP